MVLIPPYEGGLVSGLVAHESVNVNDAKEVGQSILKSMIGKSVTSISFERKIQAVTLASKAAVKIDVSMIATYEWIE